MMMRLLIGAVMALAVLTWTEIAPAGEIHTAARAGDLAKVKALLEANPQCVNEKDEQGLTPLLRAGDAAVVELLLKHQADVNAANTYGSTPLHFAALKGSIAVVELLLNYQADVNAKTERAIHPSTTPQTPSWPPS